jgi:hypothetical protein
MGSGSRRTGADNEDTLNRAVFDMVFLRMRTNVVCEATCGRADEDGGKGFVCHDFIS